MSHETTEDDFLCIKYPTHNTDFYYWLTFFHRKHKKKGGFILFDTVFQLDEYDWSDYFIRE